MIFTQQLSYQYPRSEATSATLHFPDVDLAQGDMLVLRGNSGSGKSTWLALLAGLLTPQQGELTVAGQHLNGLSNSCTRRLAGESFGVFAAKAAFE